VTASAPVTLAHATNIEREAAQLEPDRAAHEETHPLDRRRRPA
jgi:hypothetical protein